MNLRTKSHLRSIFLIWWGTISHLPDTPNYVIRRVPVRCKYSLESLNYKVGYLGFNHSSLHPVKCRTVQFPRRRPREVWHGSGSEGIDIQPLCLSTVQLEVVRLRRTFSLGPTSYHRIPSTQTPFSIYTDLCRDESIIHEGHDNLTLKDLTLTGWKKRTPTQTLLYLILRSKRFHLFLR